MTTHEKSIGLLYFATEKANRRLFFPVVGDVTEMSEPWRRGKALIFPTGTYNVVAIGWWTRDIQDDIAQDFAEGDWPEWMSSWEAEETENIPGWMNGHRTGAPPGPSKVERGPEFNALEEEEPTPGVDGS